ncbi:MAG: hypothetical protein QXQ61_03075, partial [Candidatus Bathyarchaeia archaeon]
METHFVPKRLRKKQKTKAFLTCQNAKTASIKAADTAGTSVHTTYGENVEPKNLILENNKTVTIRAGM